jgi:rubrerythrin
MGQDPFERISRRGVISKIRPVPGVVTKTEMYEGEPVDIMYGAVMWRCIVCGKLHSVREDAESCCNG